MLTKRWARREDDVSCFPQIVNNGGPKSEGGTNEPSVMFGGTAMLRPREIQVGQTHIRRDVEMAFTREPGQARKRTARPGAMDALGIRSGGTLG